MKTKLIRKHSKDCAYKVMPINLKRHGSPWGVVADNPNMFLTAAGSKGGHRYWIRFTCNDPACKAEIAVLAEDVVKQFPTGLPTR
jgi:hypothetical protein